MHTYKLITSEELTIPHTQLKTGVVLASVILLASFLSVTFVAPVLAVSTSPGVSANSYVTLGWYAVNVPSVHVINWEKIQVVSVSGKEVTWRMTGQMADGGAFPDNGDTYFINFETGATNFTHSDLGLIIPANLNAGDKLIVGSTTFVVNSTEIRTYLNVSRTINVITLVAQVVTSNGPGNTTSTYVYDQSSGMLLENEDQIVSSNVTVPRSYVDMSVSATNLFSAQTNQMPVEVIYAVVAAAVIAPIAASTIIISRRRKETEVKLKIQEGKETDSIYNLSGVNRGECYLSDSLEHCAKVLCELHSRGATALAIVREDPTLLTKTCNLKPDDVILLSTKPIQGFKAISNLQEISIAIMKFVKADGGVVLLDGLEYLISRFGFNTVYMCLQEKKIEFLEAGAVLLVPINMETLDSREKGQLLSELKLL